MEQIEWHPNYTEQDAEQMEPAVRSQNTQNKVRKDGPRLGTDEKDRIGSQNTQNKMQNRQKESGKRHKMQNRNQNTQNKKQNRWNRQNGSQNTPLL